MKPRLVNLMFFCRVPGAKLTVISAGMTEDADGVPFANWKLYYADGSKDSNVKGLEPKDAYIYCVSKISTPQEGCIDHPLWFIQQ